MARETKYYDRDLRPITKEEFDALTSSDAPALPVLEIADQEPDDGEGDHDNG